MVLLLSMKKYRVTVLFFVLLFSFAKAEDDSYLELPFPELDVADSLCESNKGHCNDFGVNISFTVSNLEDLNIGLQTNIDSIAFQYKYFSEMDIFNEDAIQYAENNVAKLLLPLLDKIKYYTSINFKPTSVQLKITARLQNILGQILTLNLRSSFREFIFKDFSFDDLYKCNVTQFLKNQKIIDKIKRKTHNKINYLQINTQSFDIGNCNSISIRWINNFVNFKLQSITVQYPFDNVNHYLSKAECIKLYTELDFPVDKSICSFK